MSIPDFPSLMLPTLRHLCQREHSTSELVRLLSDEFALTVSEREESFPTNRRLIMPNRIHWAIVKLGEAKLIAKKSIGHYIATDAGKRFLETPRDRITLEDLKKIPEYMAARAESGTLFPTSERYTGAGTEANILPVTPEERIDSAYREVLKDVSVTLLDRIRTLTPAAFEQLIMDVLVALGYGGARRGAAKRIGRTGDGGVDGVIHEDYLGLDNIYVQAKRYSADNTVGPSTMRDFAGALLSQGATKGVFATTSSFTQQAEDYVATLRDRKIVLIDGTELARLMIEHDIGVRTVQTIRIQRVDLDVYEEDSPS